MATSKLAIYNGALLICGERSLSAVDEAIEPRRLLDIVWDDGGVDQCLSQAQWKFAIRTSMLTYNPAIAPSFGYQRGFDIPTDVVLWAAVCQDEYFRMPLLRYSDEAGYLWCDLDTIYVRYVSNDVSYGGDLAKWSALFTEYVKHFFAGKIINKLTSDKERRDELNHPRTGSVARTLLDAKNKDAMRDPTKFAPDGLWVRARTGRSYGGPLGDGGNSGSLIG